MPVGSSVRGEPVKIELELKVASRALMKVAPTSEPVEDQSRGKNADKEACSSLNCRSVDTRTPFGLGRSSRASEASTSRCCSSRARPSCGSSSA